MTDRIAVVLISCMVFTLQSVTGIDENMPSISDEFCSSESRVDIRETDGGVIIGRTLQDQICPERNNCFVETGGLYLFPQPIPQAGTITQISTVGQASQDDLLVGETWLIIAVLLRIEDNVLRSALMSPAPIFQNGSSSSGLISPSWDVTEGSYVGALIPEECVENDVIGMTVCPSHVNQLFNKSTCLSALFFANVTFSDLLDGIDLDDAEEVQIQLSMEVTITAADLDSSNMLRDTIIGIVPVTGFLLLGALLVLAVYIIRCSRKNKSDPKSTNLELPNENDAEYTTPYYSVIADQQTNYSSGYEVVLQVMEPGQVNYTQASEYDYERPYFAPATFEEELLEQLRVMLTVPEVDRGDLKLNKVIGKGAFGTVHKGVWRHSSKENPNEMVEEEVAVKSLENGDDESERVKFLQEAAIMAQFKHINIVHIKGILFENPMMLVLELLGGNLREHLRENLRKRLDTMDSMEVYCILLSYSRQIIYGLGNLLAKGYIHRDLAARNILVDTNGLECKIADFGLSRKLQNDDYYVSQGGMVPVKWTAPEALQYKKYSSSSDIWSYGCVLYEIWSLGEKPFRDMSNVEVKEIVATDYRLPPPPGCLRSIYEIMIKCWHPDPSEREALCSFVKVLQHSDFHLVKWSPEDVSKYSEDIRTIGKPLELGQELFKDLQSVYMK